MKCVRASLIGWLVWCHFVVVEALRRMRGAQDIIDILLEVIPKNQPATILVALLRRKQGQCPHLATVYCYVDQSEKPRLAEKEDAIQPVHVNVTTGCEYKIKFVNIAGGSKAYECDGTIFVDDIFAHGSMRIGTIPHLPHRSCRDPSEIQIRLVPSDKPNSVKAIAKTVKIIKCQIAS